MSSEKTLSEHAAYELTKAGMTDNADPEARQVATNTMALVRRIEKMSMSEKQLNFTLEAFALLCQHLPLTPITDDPEEWDRYEIDRKNLSTNEIEKKEVWQSKRSPSIFSEDKGKTFVDQRTGQAGTALDHVKQAEEQAAAKERAKTRSQQPAKPKDVLSDTPGNEMPATAPVATTKPEPTAAPEKDAAPEGEAKEESK